RRPGDRPEDRRLPDAARRLRLGRRARRCARHRAGAARRLAPAGGALIRAQPLAAGFCGGLALANLGRLGLAAGVVLSCLAVAGLPRALVGVVCVALLGWW